MARFRIREHHRPWGKRYTVALIADNGEPTGDVYAQIDNAVEGCNAIRRAAIEATMVELPDGRIRTLS